LAGGATITAEDLEELKDTFKTFMFDVLGLVVEGGDTSSEGNEAYKEAVDLIMELRKEAKTRKDWATADFIRNRLAEIGFEVKDTKDGVEWKLNK